MPTIKKTHPCAVCQKPIGLGFLMCGKHWKLVPRPEQNKVYRTWDAVQKAARTGEHVSATERYLEAAAAAVASVRQAQAEQGASA